MPGRVREDPPATGVDMQQRGAETHDLFLGSVEIRDIDIQVKLLRVAGVGPPRSPVVGHALERQYEAKTRVKRREVVTDCPPVIRLVDRAAKKRLVEAGEFCDIRTVQNHTLKPADHQSTSQ
jgi:hypothetical protein